MGCGHARLRRAIEVLQWIRAGQAPEEVAHIFAGSRPFLEEFFPGQADRVVLR